MKFIKYLFHIDHLIITLMAFFIMGVLALFTFNTSFMSPLAKSLKNISMMDVFFKIQNSTVTPDTCQLITIVDMTELTSRGEIGELLMDIYKMNPTCIGVDLIFEGEKDDIEGNLLLEEAVSNITDKTFFSCKLTDYDQQTESFKKSVNSYFKPLFPIKEGFANITDNMEKATIRTCTTSLKFKNESIKSFPAAIAKFMGTENSGKQEFTTINYEPVVFPCVSYKDIKNNRDLIEGHIVLVGTMTEEQDMHLSPLGKMPGLEIQAYSTLTLLEHKEIIHFSKATNICIAFILCYMFELLLGLLTLVISKSSPSHKIFMSESKIPSRIISLTWVTLVTFAFFFLFAKYSIYADTVLIIALLAFVTESRRQYGAIIKSLTVKHKNKLINNSLFK